MIDKLKLMLLEDFPTLLNDKTIITCDDGWYSQIYEFLKMANEIIKVKGLQNVSVKRICSSGGGISVTIFNVSPELESLVSNLKSLCFNSCEQCGKAGEYSTELHKVVCKKHSKTIM